jgi:hypothetical protein
MSTKSTKTKTREAPLPTIVRYRKACKCEGPSTANRIVAETRRDGGILRLVAQFCPMPVCDLCNTPWEPYSEADSLG